MIDAIGLKLLRNAEFLQFLDFIIKTIENNNPATLKVAPKLLALNNYYDQLEALFKQPQDSLHSAELLELDHQRDRIISGILQMVSANLNSFDQDRVTAAQLVDRNLRNYGSQIYSMNYQAESSTVTSIIKDWEADAALVSAVTLLDLDGWKTELKNKNNAFIALYSDRNQEYAAGNTDKTKSKRLEANAAYYDLMQLLNAHATIENTPAYQKVMSEINTLIESYNTLLRSRKGKKKQDE